MLTLKDPSLLKQLCYLNGQWLAADSGAVIDVTNPANGIQLGTIPRMGTDETRRAIDSANRALPAWRSKTAKERSTILRRWFDLIMANQDDLAVIMTAEQGKPLAEDQLFQRHRSAAGRHPARDELVILLVRQDINEP